MNWEVHFKTEPTNTSQTLRFKNLVFFHKSVVEFRDRILRKFLPLNPNQWPMARKTSRLKLEKLGEQKTSNWNSSLPTTWRIIPFSKWLVTPIYEPFRPFGMEQPHLGDLLSMVINHLLTGMILQPVCNGALVISNHFAFVKICCVI